MNMSDPFARVCRSCGGPLTQPWQKRCCSVSCAARQTPIRDQSGERNGNFKGWRSRDKSAYARHYEELHPEKVWANRLVHVAIKKGLLVRPTACGSCGVACRPDGHHEDYTKPYEVLWACRKCHLVLDRQRAARERVIPQSDTVRTGSVLARSGRF